MNKKQKKYIFSNYFFVFVTFLDAIFIRIKLTIQDFGCYFSFLLLLHLKLLLKLKLDNLLDLLNKLQTNKFLIVIFE